MTVTPYVILPFIGQPTVDIHADSPSELNNLDVLPILQKIAREWHAAGEAIRCRGTKSAAARRKRQNLEVAQLCSEAAEYLEGRIERRSDGVLTVYLGRI